MSLETRIREEICTVGASLYQRGYTVGAAGNISARLDDGWLITPTDACLGRLDPAGLAKVDLAGNPVSGGKPSKTLALHRGIYQADPAARGVVHTHSTHLVALTLAGVWRQDEVLPPITPYQVMKVGRIPLIPYRRPGDPVAAARVAALAAQVRGAVRAPGARGVGAVGVTRIPCAGGTGRDRAPVADVRAPARAPVRDGDRGITRRVRGALLIRASRGPTAPATT